MRAVCSTHCRDHKCLQNVCLKISREEENRKREAHRILLQYVISRMYWTYLSHGKEKWWAILYM
jgi:hypothetical protein